MEVLNVGASVALAVAERVERTGGPKAGLVAWRALAQSSASFDVRGKAILAALRCALALRDVAALTELTTLWEAIDEGVWGDAVTTLAKDMAKAGLLVSATELSHAEVRRHATARSLYGYARCLDVAGDPRAADAFASAIARAEREGSRDIELSSRVRRSAWLARSFETIDAAVEVAKGIDLSRARPTERLVAARVMLLSPSRFVRAGALDALDALVQGPDAALAARALTQCARFVDEHGDRLTSLELDRLLAIFGREAVVKAAPRARAALRAVHRIATAATDEALDAALADAVEVEPALAPLHARARDIVNGRFIPVEEPSAAGPAADPGARARARWAHACAAAAALRDGSHARAAQELRALAEAEERGERVPPQCLLLVKRALYVDDSELRGVAGRLVAARLARPSGGPPPGGWLSLATALVMASMNDLAAQARRAASAAKEPGGADALALSLTREAWQLAHDGDRARAIARLREAKALAGPPPSSAPRSPAATTRSP